MGSYIPEFLHGQEESDDIGDHASSPAAHLRDADLFEDTGPEEHRTQGISRVPWGSRTCDPAVQTEAVPSPFLARRASQTIVKGFLWLGLGGVMVIGFLAGIAWRSRSVSTPTAIDDFWMPVLHEQGTVLICAGGVVFTQNNFSGVITAGKDIDYPFVSMQTASAIAQVSSTLARSGVTTQLLSLPLRPCRTFANIPSYCSALTTTNGRCVYCSRSVFNLRRSQFNRLSIRCGLRRTGRATRSLPYASADDYALVARFRDATTGSWVVVLAGLGRNGTEAAAQFATSPHYMQLLRDDVGRDFSNLNIEALLKVNVIDGKTGAPSILAVHAR